MQARAGPQSFYEGWSSMNKQLIQKGWVASRYHVGPFLSVLCIVLGFF